MEAPNEEFLAFIFRREAKLWIHSPATSPSLLDILDDLNRINNLGRWKTPKDSQLLALMANFANLQKECTSLKALLAAKELKPPPSGIKKPPKWKEGEPEVVDFDGTTWKWCAKSFSGSWNKTHTTSKHVRGRGKQQQHQTPQSEGGKALLASADTPPPTPTADASAMANVGIPTTFEMDFM